MRSDLVPSTFASGLADSGRPCAPVESGRSSDRRVAVNGRIVSNSQGRISRHGPFNDVELRIARTSHRRHHFLSFLDEAGVDGDPVAGTAGNSDDSVFTLQ